MMMLNVLKARVGGPYKALEGPGRRWHSSKTITIDAVVQPGFLLFQWCDSQPFIGAGQEKKICKLKILGYLNLIQRGVDCVKFLEHIKLGYFRALSSLV